MTIDQTTDATIQEMSLRITKIRENISHLLQAPADLENVKYSAEALSEHTRKLEKAFNQLKEYNERLFLAAR